MRQSICRWNVFTIPYNFCDADGGMLNVDGGERPFLSIHATLITAGDLTCGSSGGPR